ncbi:hypothetical protein ACJW30_09G031100 [Castanea mollissima]
MGPLLSVLSNHHLSFFSFLFGSSSLHVSSSVSSFLSFFFSSRLNCSFFQFLFLSSKPTATPHGETSSNLRSCTPFPTLEAPAPTTEHLQLRRSSLLQGRAAPSKHNLIPLHLHRICPPSLCYWVLDVKLFGFYVYISL